MKHLERQFFNMRYQNSSPFPPSAIVEDRSAYWSFARSAGKNQKRVFILGN
jgi:hypothetical protein